MASTVIVGVILIIAAVIYSYFAYRQYQEKLATEDWIGLQARVIDARFTKKSDEDENWIDCFLNFEYVINAEVYRNSGTKKEYNVKKRQAKKMYYPGAPIQIYYNPRNPMQSKFHKGVGAAAYVPFIIPLLLLIIGFSLL